MATTLKITADEPFKNEGNSGLTSFNFTVKREGDLSGTSSVDWGSTASYDDALSKYSSVSPSDFGLLSFPRGTITFLPGESVKTITLDVKGDGLIELDEEFIVLLTTSTGADVAVGFGSAKAKILNDDTLESGFTVINSPPGVGRLEGSAGKNLFQFAIPDEFGGNSADLITNFNAAEGDKLLFALTAIRGAKNSSLKIVGTPKAFKKALKSKSTFVYNQRNGELFFNANGKKSGLGKGGLLATLEGSPQLFPSSIELISNADLI